MVKVRASVFKSWLNLHYKCDPDVKWDCWVRRRRTKSILQGAVTNFVARLPSMYRRFLPDFSHSFGWFCETLVGHNVLQMRRNELKYGFYCQNPACFSNISFNSPAELHGQKIWNTINLIHDDNNNGCVAHWISFALSRQRSRARLPAVRCRCFLWVFFGNT